MYTYFALLLNILLHSLNYIILDILNHICVLIEINNIYIATQYLHFIFPDKYINHHVNRNDSTL